MLTREEDIDAHALRRQGWSISAIARHLGRDRKTIRAYLNNERVAGNRKPAEDDRFEPFAAYVRARLAEDPHLWAVTLFDEVSGLGYDRSYPTFTRQIRVRGLRPHCEPCSATKGRPNAPIAHPAGEETQWDWVELPDPPTSWGWGKNAHLLVGALAHSSRWRGTLAAAEDQAQLIDALDKTTRKLGGLTKKWRFDRMTTVCHPESGKVTATFAAVAKHYGVQVAICPPRRGMTTVCHPESGKVTATFAAVAKHYGVQVAICPPRRGNRKGVVEKSNHTAAQRWWRTLPDDVTVEEAQASLDRFCELRGDARLRPSGVDGRASVLTIAEREPLSPVPPTPFPATISEERTVSAQALVAWRGNFYSVPPELARAQVVVSQRLGGAHVDIATVGGIVIARHQLAPDGAGVMVRDHGHVIALEQLVLAGHDTSRPHRKKERIPPGPAARAAAEVLRARQQPAPDTAGNGDHADVVIDLSKYDRAATGRNTLT